MRSVSEHRAAVLELAVELPTGLAALAEADGLALAEDVVSELPLPNFDNSAMDGYAVRSADVAAAPVRLPVSADIPAGRTDAPPLAPGTAARIMTGAMVPAGADAVVQVEWTDAGAGGGPGGGPEGGAVLVERPVPPGMHIRRAGDDAPAGTRILAAGSELTPAALGVLAAPGRTHAVVRRRAVVGVLATGSELVAPGQPLLPGQIYDSNATMLAACVRATGARPVVIDRVPDTPAEAAAVLDAALDGLDLLVTSGGISAGAFEVVKDVLEPRGVSFVRVAMQPGGPQGLGTLHASDGRPVPVVTLPGNPVSSYVSYELFVRPLVRRMLGHTVLDRPRYPAVLTGAVERRGDRVQFRRGRHDTASGRVSVHGGAGSHLLAMLAGADCLVEVPPGQGVLAAGSTVTVLPLR